MNENEALFANLRDSVKEYLHGYAQEGIVYADPVLADDGRMEAATSRVLARRATYQANLYALARLLGVPFAGLDEEEIA